MKLRILAWLPLCLTVIVAGAYGVVHSLNGEDAAVVAGNDDTAEPEPETQAQPEAPKQKDADYVAFEGGLRAYPQKRVVEMDAWLLGSQTRPLEYLLVSPGGNTHESLFATSASGLHLKRALEIIGLAEGKEKRSGRGYLDKPVGDRVKLSVRFNHAKTGKETTVAVEEWLWDHQNNAHPDRVGFIFTGSFEQFRGELNRSLFEADMKGNLIGMWRDSACVLDNDRDDGYVPDIYSPYPEADGIPQTIRGVTPQVTLLFERWPAEEKKD
ncbi:MAG: hypothetical protein KDB90_07620 [Planctomycetes bacterium]|nr:hypothetical protein [Planctomycetota bacterium]